MEEQFLACRKKAMSLLNQRDRTEWELKDRLKNAGFPEEEVADAISYVRGFHYIDDFRYAVHFAEVYRESRSIRRITQDLKRKHVPEEYIDTALEQIAFDDSIALKKELKKRLKGKTELTEQEKQKIAAGLYRKGFRTSDIFHEMEEIL